MTQKVSDSSEGCSSAKTSASTSDTTETSTASPSVATPQRAPLDTPLPSRLVGCWRSPRSGDYQPFLLTLWYRLPPSDIALFCLMED